MMKNFLLLLAILTSISAMAQKDKRLTNKTVSKDNIAAHLKFLSSDAMKGRDTPSPQLEIAAAYLKTQLERYGVQPFPEYPDYLQPVSMKKIIKPSQGIIAVDTSSFVIADDFLLLDGSNMEWNGAFVYLDYGMPDEITTANVEGKIIVTNTGDGEEQNPRAWFRLSREKRAAAQEAGAVGFVELYNSAQLPWQLLVRYLNRDRVVLNDDESEDSSPFNAIWMNNPNRAKSPAFEGEDSLSITIAGADNEEFTVHNVVGYIEGTDAALKDDYVAYTAHYDHIGVGQADSTGDDIYNGARDNGVGTVTVLEAARNLGQYPTKRSSLFVLFAGEEKGLLGSEWYVNHSPLPLEDIVFCFNSDNGGYNDTSLVTVIGLYRTTAEENLIAAIEAFGLEAGNDANYKEQGLFDRSDNVSFAKKGIPAPSFGMGVSEFDERIFQTYHQPSDEFETIDMDYLDTFYRAYVLAGRMIGNMKETPFWIEGDKYYEAGKALYDK